MLERGKAATVGPWGKENSLGKYLGVKKIPTARKSVGHNVEGGRNVGGLETVTEVALVLGGAATKVGQGCTAGYGSGVVGQGAYGAFVDVVMLGKHIKVVDDANLFDVGIEDGTGWVGEGD